MKDNYTKLLKKFDNFNKKSKNQELFLLGDILYIRDKNSNNVYRLKIMIEELEKYNVNKLYKWILEGFNLS